MRYALRKLIAFVFLGGIFWFVYYDVANIFEPNFQLVVGAMVAIFAVFWLVVPWLVIKMRIAKRVKQNRAGYVEWKEEKREKDELKASKNGRLSLEEGETEVFHEKGTLYVEPGAGFDEISHPGKIGDVAFPKEPRNWRKIQRVHFYLTNRRLWFAGKEIDFRTPFGEVSDYWMTPGGIVFRIKGRKFAFTFRNPLIVNDLIGTVFAK